MPQPFMVKNSVRPLCVATVCIQVSLMVEGTAKTPVRRLCPKFLPVDTVSGALRPVCIIAPKSS